MQFKKGDIVQVVKRIGFSDYNKRLKGKVCKVTSTDREWCSVEYLDKNVYVECKDIIAKKMFMNQELRKIPEKEVLAYLI